MSCVCQNSKFTFCDLWFKKIWVTLSPEYKKLCVYLFVSFINIRVCVCVCVKVGVRTQRSEELHALDVQERLLEMGGQCIFGPQ